MTKTVLVTGVRAPSAAHAARLLADGGLTVYATDSLDNVLTRRSRAVHLTLRHPSPRTDYIAFRTWLAEAVERHNIDLIFPTCEEVLHLARATKELGISRKLFAPDVDVVLAHHDKFAFVETMRRIGMPAPKTRLIRSQSSLEAVLDEAPDLVFKPALSRFASRVLIRPTAERAARLRPSAEDPWVAQEALTGPEICIYIVARRGHLCGVSAYRSLHRAGIGAGICFEPVSDPRIMAFAKKFAAASSWTGQAAFDCIDTEQGLVPIECNPRSTSGIHFFTDGPAFVSALKGSTMVLPEEDILQVVPAMLTFGFSQALARGDLKAWGRDLLRARSATRYAAPGVISTASCLVEIALGAIRRRQSLAEASTYDIEWDAEAARYL